MRLRWTIPVLVLVLSWTASTRADLVSTFEDLAIAPNSVNLQLGGAIGAFTSGGNTFNSVYNADFNSVSAWAASSLKNPDPFPTDAGNDYNFAYQAVPGVGSGPSATYGIAFTAGGSVTDPIDPATFLTADPTHPHGAYVNLATGADPISIDVTNTTYDYLSMKYGDGFGKQFGSGDYFRLTIEGYAGANGSGTRIGEKDFDLANYTDVNPNNWSIVTDWRTVDLTSLKGAGSLVFGLRSSDNDPSYGINTPAFFAADNLVARVRAVPEPASLALMGIGLVGIAALRRKKCRTTAILSTLMMMVLPATSRADYDPQVGLAGSLGIAKSSPLFTEWASSVASITRGPQDITNPTGALASFGTAANALGIIGPNDGSRLVSLGDGGQITLGFAQPIADGDGADFAVFENGFLSGSAGSGLAYLELAFVDVSSDGVNFFRFHSVSLTQTTTQVGGFSSLDARNLNNLAGKYISGYGTGFDLSELAGVSPLLDIHRVTFVRITDVVGSIDPQYGSRDSLGNLINDPFKTPFASGGFDLNGVGVIHTRAVPEPTSGMLFVSGCGILTVIGRLRRKGVVGLDRMAGREEVSQ